MVSCHRQLPLPALLTSFLPSPRMPFIDDRLLQQLKQPPYSAYQLFLPRFTLTILSSWPVANPHYNKMHILWLPFMTAPSHKILKYDWRWIGGGWRARWLGLVITDKSLWTSVIWIYTIVWVYKRTKSTFPAARGAWLDWPWTPCPSLTCSGQKYQSDVTCDFV